MSDETLLSLLGRAAQQVGSRRHREAVEIYRAALRLAPQRAETHFGLGCSLSQCGELDAARAALTMAIQLDPSLSLAYAFLARTLGAMGRLEDALAAFRRGLSVDPGNATLHSGLLFLLIFTGDGNRTRAEERRWNERHAVPLRAYWKSHLNARDPERPLKIGYVSNCFRLHATAFFSHALMAHHDRRRFEITAYSDTTHPDEVTEKFRARVHHWRETAQWDDERLAEAIRQDGIDILVDLVMHMAGNRMLVFARKPAPVQVTWIAYPGSTGLDAIDYRISDRYLDPSPAEDDGYAEKTVRLPDCFWCYDPLTEEPAANALPASAKGCVTFGCLNQLIKVNDATLALWARVLNQVENSRLLLFAPAGSAREQVATVLARYGVSRDRVRFARPRERIAYLSLYHHVDIALDPIPYGGHTTLCDALWMGVPTVALAGTTPASRAGVSLLNAVELPQFIAATQEDYVRIAVDTSQNLGALATLRAGLRKSMTMSPLMDGTRFAANMEAAFREMWRCWCVLQ